MKSPKGKKAAASAPKKDVLSKKTKETNLKRKAKEDKTKTSQTRKEKKGKKDPNKPKRPASAFFVFLEEFRKTYMAEHPGLKSVAAVGKAGGEKWKSMSEADKAPYVAKAQKRKAEYEKTIRLYNQGAVAEESDKSKSEVNDEEEGSADADEELEEEEEDE